MSDAPDWLVELLETHQTETVEATQVVFCHGCGWQELYGIGVTPAYATADHQSQIVWDAITKEDESKSIDLYGGKIRFTFPEQRVIPSRTTDPVTSHKAAATITVKAGTQRAHLLETFWIAESHSWGVDGLTDEEAQSINANVHPSSEYSKRCSELREAGLIEPTGETRTGASGHQRIVSRITEAGRKVVQSL